MRVLFIAAHPDDTEYIAGGTVAALTIRGDEVAYLIVSSGERGLPPNEVNRRLREAEQIAAAAILGVSAVEFLRQPDGMVEDSSDLRAAIVKKIRTYKPQLVITHSPTYNLSSVRYSHRDHMAVGQAAIAAVFPESRNQNYYPEQLVAGAETWVVSEVWLLGVERPNFPFDISATLDRKIEAITKHQSQLRNVAEPAVFFREWAQDVAKAHSLAEGCFAEDFQQLHTR